MIVCKLKVLLAERNMTQKVLAEKAGIRPPTISALCLNTAKEIPVYALDKICEVLQCTPGDVFQHIEDKNN